jgi:hypothetical protein
VPPLGLIVIVPLLFPQDAVVELKIPVSKVGCATLMLVTAVHPLASVTVYE